MFFDLLPVAPEAVLLIWDVYPRSRIRIFPSLIQGLKDAGSGCTSKNVSICIPQTISKVSEILSRMFILDLDLNFFH
jgi:hypothetical protein